MTTFKELREKEASSFLNTAGGYLKDLNLQDLVLPGMVAAAAGGVAGRALSPEQAYTGESKSDQRRRKLRNAATGAALGAGTMAIPAGLRMLTTPAASATNDRRGVSGTAGDIAAWAGRTGASYAAPLGVLGASGYVFNRERGVQAREANKALGAYLKGEKDIPKQLLQRVSDLVSGGQHNAAYTTFVKEIQPLIDRGVIPRDEAYRKFLQMTGKRPSPNIPAVSGAGGLGLTQVEASPTMRRLMGGGKVGGDLLERLNARIMGNPGISENSIVRRILGHRDPRGTRGYLPNLYHRYGQLSGGNMMRRLRRVGGVGALAGLAYGTQRALTGN